MVQEGKTHPRPMRDGLRSCLFRDLNKPDKCLTIRCSWVLPSQDSIAQRLLEGPAFEPPKETNKKIKLLQRSVKNCSTKKKHIFKYMFLRCFKQTIPSGKTNITMFHIHIFSIGHTYLQSGFIFQPAMLVYRSVVQNLSSSFLLIILFVDLHCCFNIICLPTKKIMEFMQLCRLRFAVFFFSPGLRETTQGKAPGGHTTSISTFGLKTWRMISHFPNAQLIGGWVSTHLKNMRKSKLGISFPQFFGWK